MIKLTNDIAISADRYNYIVGTPRKRVVESGKVVESIDNATYHTTLSTALTAALTVMLRKKIVDCEVTELRGLVKEQEILQSRFEEMLKPLVV